MKKILHSNTAVTSQCLVGKHLAGVEKNHNISIMSNTEIVRGAVMWLLAGLYNCFVRRKASCLFLKKAATVLTVCLLIKSSTGATYPVKSVFQDFKSCFQSSMQKLKEKDSSLALFISPDTDPKLIAAAFPMDKINMSDIPTELGKVMVSDMTLEERHSSNLSNKVGNSPSNGLEYAPKSKLGHKEKVKYMLFTEENKNQYQVMRRYGSVDGTTWRSGRKTKVLVHGLTSTVWLPPLVNIWSQHIFQIKNAYLKKSENASLYNVIVMDWTALSTVPLFRYPEAALSTKEAGDDLAEFLLNLRNSGSISNWNDVHIVGHSLGCHVAGIAGSELRKKGSEYTLQRITGLDPAGLCFDTNTPTDEDLEGILDSTDAKFVDIVHTNMGNLIKSVAGKYGSVMETGHAEFYPNGGESQNGCSIIGDRLNFCSHQKSVVFYANSIWDKAVSCPCSSWDVFRSNGCTCTTQNGGQYMGEYCDYSARGKYFLEM